MNAQRFIVSRFFIGLTALLLLIGCAAFQPAASIRVEVDVYKGPLSKPLDVQKAELLGIVRDAVSVAGGYTFLLKEAAYFNNCPSPDANASDNESYISRLMTADCKVLTDLSDKLCNSFYQLSIFLPQNNRDKRLEEYCSGPLRISQNFGPVPDDKFIDKNEHKFIITPFPVHKPQDFSSVLLTEDNDQLKKSLSNLAALAAQFKAQSAATTVGFVPFVSSEEFLRIAQSLFAVMSSEYGNLIGSRADTLTIQLYGYGRKNDLGGIDRSQLHLSKYLSDSSATKVPKLYEWYDAKAPFLIEEWKYFIPGNNASMRERGQIYETIFNDIYWSNVNTVYASGVDKVNMALIRDEIGNWNLKNFDNDPTELLKAYKDLTIQSIKTAIELAKVSSGGTAQAVDTAVAIANRIASRLDDTGPPTVPVAKYKQRIVAQLESLKQTSQAEWDAMNCKSAATDDQKASCKEILKTMNKKTKDLLQDYSIVLDTLQEVSLPTTPKKTEENVPTLKQVTGK